ncbi:hypothetical protein GOBAR_AA34235 [Gossypium barbadense]|uniref:Uncharacterized protein n=1 Tax=Gossypium barbadense TaxID=3634 RepID=A0A2P5W5V0_GOSBA|nr:hypothetical protein GOBAR_AA34235 [Gossypium barbadense]
MKPKEEVRPVASSSPPIKTGRRLYSRSASFSPFGDRWAGSGAVTIGVSVLGFSVYPDKRKGAYVFSCLFFFLRSRESECSH